MLTKTFILSLSLVVASVSAATSRFNVDPAKVTVSGLSSGGYFAVQVHVAYSSLFKGAGVLAGGPYYCSKGSYMTATGPCMARPSGINVNELVRIAKDWSAAGKIDPVANLAGHPVYMLWGKKDTSVAGGVMDKLEIFYQNFGSDVTYNKDIAAAHGFITEDYGNLCSISSPPYINKCKYDGAGAILGKVYGQLNAKAQSLGGSFVEFDQSASFEGTRSYGLANTGWLYAPKNCLDGAKCGLHVAFHGCLQSYGNLGDVYVKNTGYNEWADTNDLIVMYPQTGRGATNACWDWWGDQGDPKTFAQKTGRQMSAVRRMVDGLMGNQTEPGRSTTTPVGNQTEPSRSTTKPVGDCFTTNNYEHVSAGRAYQKMGYVYAKGSDDFMGLFNIFAYSKLRQTAPDYYVIDETC